MRTVGAALALAAALGCATAGHPAAAQPRTIVTSRTPIAAFAQDGGSFAWIARGGPCRYHLSIRNLSGARARVLPRIACQGRLGSELALGGGRALWRVDDVSVTNTKSRVDVRSAALDAPRIRSTQWLVDKDERTGRAHARFPLAGGGGLLAYYAQDDEEEDYAVWRVGPTRDRRLFGLPQFEVDVPAGLAVHAGRIAIVQGGTPNRGQIRSAAGRRLAAFKPEGRPLAVALSASHIAVLTRGSGGRQLELFDARTGAARGKAAVPAATASRIALSARFAVFSSGPSIRTLDVRTLQPSVLVQAAGRPVGLSLSGRRLAWAENAAGRGRVRSLTLPG